MYKNKVHTDPTEKGLLSSEWGFHSFRLQTSDQPLQSIASLDGYFHIGNIVND
jgi:hypothetical protein